MTIDRKMLALIGGAAIIALVGGGAGYVLRGDAAHSDEAAQSAEPGGDAGCGDERTRREGDDFPVGGRKRQPNRR